MLMPGRNEVIGEGYRFAFNGKEFDSEVAGNGNQYDYGFRIYNPRIGRFLSVDPLTKSYPMLTPYQFASNMPIWAVDLDGKEALIINHNTKEVKVIGNMFYVTEGNYKVSSRPELETEIKEQIINKIQSDRELKSLGGYSISISLNSFDGGSYSENIEKAKHSTIHYLDENGIDQKIVNYRTGVVIAQTGKDNMSDELYREYFKNYIRYAVFDLKPSRGKFRLIALKTPTESDIGEGATYGQLIKTLRKKFLHEVGHFIGVGYHSEDVGLKEGITANDDDKLKLTKTDLSHIIGIGIKRQGVVKEIEKSEKKENGIEKQDTKDND